MEDQVKKYITIAIWPTGELRVYGQDKIDDALIIGADRHDLTLLRVATDDPVLHRYGGEFIERITR